MAAVGGCSMPDDSRAERPADLCLLKRAVKNLLEQHPEGMTRAEICRRLLLGTDFSGTYRSLLAQVNSILNVMVEEGRVRCRGSGSAGIYVRADGATPSRSVL